VLVLKILLSFFLCWSAIDRLKSTFTKASFSHKKYSVFDKLFSFFIILIYALIVIDGYVSFLRADVNPNLIVVIFGIGIYLFARYIRVSTIRVLGYQWVNHSSPTGIRKIITIGPYKYSRHPYYWATIIDLLGYSMIFGSTRTALLTFLICTPMMLVRVLLEERELHKKFTVVYRNYVKNVNVLLSLKNLVQNLPYLKDLFQIIEIVRKFGVSKIFLMSSLKHTISRYSRGYAVSRIVGALIEVGFVELILKLGKLDIRKFCSDRDIDFETLKVLCNYLAVLEILEKKNFTYSITAYGRKIFDDTRGALSLLYAYMPVFEALPDILFKRRQYGRDVSRRIDFVGIGSNELSATLPFPYARDILMRHNLKNVLDVGCGAGDFLLYSYKDNGFGGCGIDISQEAINIAKERLAGTKISSKVLFKVCDLQDLPFRSKEFAEYDVLSFMFVLHEFLSNDRDAVAKILARLRRAFPATKIFIAEVYRLTVPELIKKRPPIAEHHLFHSLSKQGLATLKEWRFFFQKAGYTILEEKRLDLAAQAYFLLTPVEAV